MTTPQSTTPTKTRYLSLFSPSDNEINVLNRAIKLVRRGWTKGACCRNNLGDPVYSRSTEVVSCDILGAICRAGGAEKVGEKLTNYVYSITGMDVVGFNDKCKSRNEIIKVLNGFKLQLKGKQ